MTSQSTIYGALPLTKAARSFFTEHYRLRTLAVYLVNASIAMHATVETAFAQTADLDEALTRLSDALRYEGTQRPPYPEEVAYKHHRGLVAEMMVSRSVDNFITYLSDVMAEALKARPESLRSNATEPLEYILQFDTMEALRHALAEREVERLAYLGMRKLSEELKKSQKLELFPTAQELDEAVYWVEVRNLSPQQGDRQQHLSSSFTEACHTCRSTRTDRVR